MYAVTVTLEIAEGSMDPFMELMQENATASLRDEPGCQRFDVCINPGSSKVFLYELYDDQAAFKSHLQSPHFKRFDAATASMILDKTIACFDQVFP